MSIESRLRALSDPERWDEVPVPTLGVRRPRRLVPVLAAASAVLLVVGTVVGVSRVAHPGAAPAPPVAPVAPVTSASDGAVPWVDTKAGPAPMVPTDAPACRAGQLSAPPLGVGGPAAGTYYVTAELTNRGTACSIAPHSISMRGRGRGLASLALLEGEVTLAPGAALAVRAYHGDGTGEGPHSCDLRDNHRDRVRLLVGGGVLTSGREPYVRCPAPWGLFADRTVSAQDNGTGPYSSLRAHVVPGSGRLVDGVLHYQVRLTDTSKTAFTFAHCPSYTETVKADTKFYDLDVRPRYRLDCADVGQIPPGDSVTFDMEATLPAQAADARRVAVGWVLDDGPRALGHLRIAPGS